MLDIAGDGHDRGITAAAAHEDEEVGPEAVMRQMTDDEVTEEPPQKKRRGRPAGKRNNHRGPFALRKLKQNPAPHTAVNRQ